LKPRFEKIKVKCYNCEKMGHYARDCWNPTRIVEENATLVVEEEKKTTLFLVHSERIQAIKNIW
jgi:hypothetical protein